MSSPSSLLLEGTEQEEVEQSQVVLQRVWSLGQAKRQVLYASACNDPNSDVCVVCILLDVGTKPTGTSIYELWKCKCHSGVCVALMANTPVYRLRQALQCWWRVWRVSLQRI